ncbi:MAG: tetratricopeptide repeat protein [Acidimicrobiia bacterium]|nr:tetratricopeptide repeat protein [Acidimicrobiia bacterium]
MNTPVRAELERRRDRALDDLVALDAQEACGELDTATAAQLRSRYEAEAAAALRALEAPVASPAPGRSGRRIAAALVAFAAIAVIVVIALVTAVEPRPEGGFATGGPESGTTVDLDAVSVEEMEQVVAANPDIIPMRLALARRYVEAGDFSSALPHYFAVLERDERNPEALMYLGWMTYLSGDAATGVSLLEQSLEVAPGDVLAMWLLANARYHGLGDRVGAIPLLEAVLASGQAPADIVAEAERMIAEARS